MNDHLQILPLNVNSGHPRLDEKKKHMHVFIRHISLL